MTEEGKIKIEKFDGTAYALWRVKIEDYLYQKKLHLPLEEEAPADMKPADWTLLDRQALGVVRLTLADNVAYNVLTEKTTHSMLKALADMYEKPSASNKVYLIRKLVNMKMKEGGNVANHINDFNSLLAQLTSVTVKFDDEVQALFLLSSMPDSWDATVTAVSSSSGDTKLTFKGVRDLILSEDIRRRSAGQSSSASLLSTDGRGRKPQNGQRDRGRSKSRRRSQSRPRENVQCWNCQKFGHFKNQCTATKVKRGDNSVNAASIDDGDSLVCCVECPIESWIMDSGASFHATSCVDTMKNFQAGNFGKVRLADDEALDIVGK